ncbi:MAG TPA: hypothetical protein VK395_31285 [Gemmataceae bacterium]|nr:hypothetical protein [Gemmataceae bacterium]
MNELIIPVGEAEQRPRIDLSAEAGVTRCRCHFDEIEASIQRPQTRPPSLPRSLLGRVLRVGLTVLAVCAGVALVLSILQPAVFVTLVLLLVGLAPFVIVGLGIFCTEMIEAPTDP